MNFDKPFTASTRIRTASKSTSITFQSNTSKTGGVSFLEGTKPWTRVIPPIVTAAAWGIHDANTGELIWHKRSDEQREMASLTKIMTCYLSCQLLERFNEDPEKLTFTVNRIAARICGTHSGLRENEVVKVIDLLHGLMLPSGNDCAIVLAHGFGDMLLKTRKSKLIDRLPLSPVQEFIKEMNKQATKLSLKSTSFTNPHGLSEKGNKSTVEDLGKLGYHAMGVPLIEKVVSTQFYEAHVVNAQGHLRVVTWKNTNKLLEKGFAGLKTGTTPNAGYCLSSVLRKGGEGVIVTLLHVKTDEHRFNESEKLAQWALNTLLFMKGKMDCLSEITKAQITTKLLADFSKIM